MAWFKVDDQLAFHSKTMLAGNEAMGLWVRAGSWSSAHFTNGFIPEHMALAMAPPLAKEGLPSVAIDLPSRLIDAGFWHKVEGGYQFHDWDDFQPDGKAEKEKREETRKARSEAGKKGAAARWGHEIDDSKGDAEPLANAMAKDGKANGKPMAPSRPVPSYISNDTDAAEAAFADWYKDYPKKVGKGQARKAFKAALKKTDLQTLKAGLERYLKSVEGKDKEFIANPATWLNGERWDDDHTTTTSSGDDSWNKLMNWNKQN